MAALAIVLPTQVKKHAITLNGMISAPRFQYPRRLMSTCRQYDRLCDEPAAYSTSSNTSRPYAVFEAGT